MSNDNVIEDLEYGIELNQDQVSSLFTPDSSPTMAKTENTNPVVDPIEGEEKAPEVEETQATEQPTSANEETPKEDVSMYTINGQQYTEDDLNSAIESYNNKTEWQKANTQKAQELSEDRKAFVSMRDRLNTLLDKEVREELGEDHKLFELLKEAESLQVEVEDNKSIAEPNAEPNKDRIGELENKILRMETEKQVDKDIQNLIEKHPELRTSPDAVNEALSVAIEKRLSLDDAYVFANATANGESKLLQAIKEVEKANELKKQSEVTTTTKGVREEPTPVGKDYDDIAEIALSKYNLM